MVANAASMAATPVADGVAGGSLIEYYLARSGPLGQSLSAGQPDPPNVWISLWVGLVAVL